MIDYTIFYKRELPVNEPWPKEEAWDVFISAYVPGKPYETSIRAGQCYP